jgi:hypothetical protein
LFPRRLPVARLRFDDQRHEVPTVESRTRLVQATDRIEQLSDGVSVSIPVYDQEPGRNVALKFGEALDNIAGSGMATGQALN